jgi:hypothetical protein
MTKTIEQEALKTAVEASGRRMQDYNVMAEENILRRSIEAHARALEAHAKFRQEVSDAVEEFDKRSADFKLRQQDWEKLFSFIIPKPKPDPLAEVQSLLDEGLTLEEAVGNLGLKLVEVGDDD